MKPAQPIHPHLPYHDAKPQGAADFYFAINATFRFIQDKLGPRALRQYWTDLGRNYYAPVSAKWREGGLPAVADYWRDFFSAEPAADVAVSVEDNAVVLHVHRCPAIHHLRENHRQIVPSFCQHCYFVSSAMAEPARLKVRVDGGNGACRQIFSAISPGDAPQDLSQIQEATSS
jgi:hypothetical protein